MKRIIGIVLLVAMTALGVFIYKLVWGKPFGFNHAVERVMLESLLSDPETLTYLGMVENTLLDFHSAKLTDASPSFDIAMRELVRKQKNLMLSYEPEKLDSQEKLTRRIMLWYLDMLLRGGSFDYHYSSINGNGPYPVNQLFGAQSDLPTLLESSHRIESEKSGENYISRLRGFQEKFDQIIESLKLREDKGVLPPRFVVEKVIKQIDGFTGAKVSENILYTSCKEKLDTLKGLDEGEKKQLLIKCGEEISRSVYPAYNKLKNYFISLLPETGTEAGVWKLPNGQKYYAFLLEYHTSTRMTPVEIHQTGFKEVKRIEKEIKAVLAENGYGGLAVAAAMDKMTREARFRFPDNDEGRSMILQEYRSIIKKMETGLPRFFTVKGVQPVTVKRVPVFKEKTAPAAYYHPPSLDGSRPGIFYANLRDVKETPRFGMKTLAYHEAVPGHHFQISLAQGLRGIPTFRRVFPFTAYVEGWALYAERLAWEQGFHDDPFSNLGRLQAELFRAVRLVVDTGIHEKRWSRERAIAYMLKKTGMPRGDVVAEIERYIVLPGQACSYKIGMIRILKLRERMKRKEKQSFDLKKFHDQILQNGAMPLDILDSLVR